MSSLGLKIVKFQDKHYYQCQYSGVLRNKRYGIPREGLDKDRKGTFANPACAVAWVIDRTTDGSLKPEQAKKYLHAIASDLRLGQPGSPSLKRAAEVDPGSNIDWSYENSPDWAHMMKPNSGYSLIENERLSVKESSSSGNKSSSDKNMYFYSIEPETDDTQARCVCTKSEFKKILDLPEPVLTSRIVYGAYKSKDCFVLGDHDCQGVPNTQIDAMFGASLGFVGSVNILMRKPLHDDGSEVGEVTISDKHQSHSKENKSSSSSPPKQKSQNSKAQREQKIESAISSLLPDEEKTNNSSGSSSSKKRKQQTSS